MLGDSKLGYGSIVLSNMLDIEIVFVIGVIPGILSSDIWGSPRPAFFAAICIIWIVNPLKCWAGRLGLWH